MTVAIGIDIGGTFTDLHLVDEATGRRHGLKWPSDRAHPDRAVLDGLRRLLDSTGVEAGEISRICHGTTIGVNAVIERTGARLGLLTTEGFRDVLELRRVRLSTPLDFFGTLPPPLVPRRRVAEIRERLTAVGGVRVAPSREQVLDAVRPLVEEQGAEGIVVALLHAYLDGRHEAFVREVVLEEWPELDVTCSHEVLPQMREYERTITTLVNAYVYPKLRDYMRELERGLVEIGYRGPLFITRSNGGRTTTADAASSGVTCLLSGPSGGVIAVAGLAPNPGGPVITLDMGGTSADIALLTEEGPVFSRESRVEDLPILVPSIEISAVGAGGGSIARLDETGVLKVGPESAGARPGPACYGNGGQQPTVTDAYLICGYVGTATLDGGRELDLAAARAAFQPLADGLGVTVDEAAAAVLRIALAGMYRGVRGIVARHGADVSRAVFVPYGGGGPIIGCLLARELEISTIAIPRSPGTLCAQGGVGSILRADLVRSLNRGLDALDPAELAETMAELARQAGEWYERSSGGEGGEGEPRLRYVGTVRYRGQAWEVEVPVAADGDPRERIDRMRADFHDEHERLYAHADREAAVEIVDLHLMVAGPERALPPEPWAREDGRPSAVREVLFPDDGERRTAPVISRSSLGPGDRFSGPVLVEEEDTTTVVPPGWSGRVDETGNLILEDAEADRDA